MSAVHPEVQPVGKTGNISNKIRVKNEYENMKQLRLEMHDISKYLTQTTSVA